MITYNKLIAICVYIMWYDLHNLYINLWHWIVYQLMTLNNIALTSVNINVQITYTNYLPYESTRWDCALVVPLYSVILKIDHMWGRMSRAEDTGKDNREVLLLTWRPAKHPAARESYGKLSSECEIITCEYTRNTKLNRNRILADTN